MKRTQRGWFIVGVRLMGVWTLLDSLRFYRAILEVVVGWIARSGSTSLSSYFMVAFMDTLVGLYLLFYADRLARLVYPEPPAQDGGSDASAAEKDAGDPPSQDHPPE